MSKVDHVGLYVKDVENSLKFYHDFLGWKEVKRSGSGEAKIVFVDGGGCLVELIQRPGSPGKPPEGNWSHIANKVNNFHALVNKVKSMNLELREVTMGDGSHIAFFKDPDGHSIEIMEKGFSNS
ncbi:VOC family protein [Candidatus Bathyarchaeota archaeon]|nr:VOC family protein [Candidatus Bathyarchaeota archaeon]